KGFSIRAGKIRAVKTPLIRQRRDALSRDAEGYIVANSDNLIRRRRDNRQRHAINVNFATRRVTERCVEKTNAIDLLRILVANRRPRLAAVCCVNEIERRSHTGRTAHPTFRLADEPDSLQTKRRSADVHDGNAIRNPRRAAIRGFVEHNRIVRTVLLLRHVADLNRWPRHLPKIAARDRRGYESEEHTSELQSRENIVCRLLLAKKKTQTK